jgi:hypothetical protein
MFKKFLMRFETKYYKEINIDITTSLLLISWTKLIQFWIYFYCFKLLVKPSGRTAKGVTRQRLHLFNTLA